MVTSAAVLLYCRAASSPRPPRPLFATAATAAAAAGRRILPLARILCSPAFPGYPVPLAYPASPAGSPLLSLVSRASPGYPFSQVFQLRQLLRFLGL
ncbi:hypothetical protein ACU19_06785 [Actinobaculum suis]|nr:hypothetical protein ACU19_06785 [Actinobaculum suis]